MQVQRLTGHGAVEDPHEMQRGVGLRPAGRFDPGRALRRHVVDEGESAVHEGAVGVRCEEERVAEHLPFRAVRIQPDQYRRGPPQRQPVPDLLGEHRGAQPMAQSSQCVGLPGLVEPPVPHELVQVGEEVVVLEVTLRTRFQIDLGLMPFPRPAPTADPPPPSRSVFVLAEVQDFKQDVVIPRHVLSPLRTPRICQCRAE